MPDGSSSPGADPLVVVVAVVAMVVGAGWLGAELAAVVASGHRLGVGGGDVLRALARVPGSWRDPAAVWPEPARSRLPGPIGLCAAVTVVEDGPQTG